MKLFKMKSSQNIIDIFTRFIDVINELKNFDKDYTNGELICKILKSLPNNWEAKVTVFKKPKVSIS